MFWEFGGSRAGGGHTPVFDCFGSFADFGVEGDSKFIIQAVQNALGNRSVTVKLDNDPCLQPLFHVIIASLAGLPVG